MLSLEDMSVTEQPEKGEAHLLDCCHGGCDRIWQLKMAFLIARIGCPCFSKRYLCCT